MFDPLFQPQMFAAGFPGLSMVRNLMPFRSLAPSYWTYTVLGGGPPSAFRSVLRSSRHTPRPNYFVVGPLHDGSTGVGRGVEPG